MADSPPPKAGSPALEAAADLSGTGLSGTGLEYNFEESVGYWIVLASQAYQKALNDELLPQGITFRQSQVLAWLIHDGELSQVDLAARMMIEPATLVGVLDRMERDAWISRTPSESDRRRKTIRIKPQAQQAWQQIVTSARRVRARATTGLNPTQVEALRKALRVVLRNLENDSLG